MEVKAEADSNGITEHSHDDKPCTGMFVIYYAIISTLISVCLTCSLFALF